MTRRIIALLLAAAAFAADADASTNKCAAGYKDFLGKISPFVESGPEGELPGLMRRGLSILDACASGDAFASAAIWEQLIRDARGKVKPAPDAKE